MLRLFFRPLIALTLTLAAIFFPLTHNTVLTATFKGTEADTKTPAVSKPKPRLVCASGVKQSGGLGVLVDITLVVEEGEDADEIARDALARAGVRPIGEKEPTGQFALSGLRWPRFFDRDHKNNLVEQVYNPDGQNFPGAADAAANAAAQSALRPANAPTERGVAFDRAGRGRGGRSQIG